MLLLACNSEGKGGGSCYQSVLHKVTGLKIKIYFMHVFFKLLVYTGQHAECWLPAFN